MPTRLQTTTAPPVAAPPTGGETRVPDARESEEWFGRLPPAMQARCIATWERDREGLSVGPAQRQRRMARAARESAILLPILLVFVNLFLIRSAQHLLGIAVLGALVGAAAGALLGMGTNGRFRAAAIGVGAFLPAQLTLMGGESHMLALLCLFFGAWLTANVYGVYGLRLEDRARPGSGED
jgi:hypothetical protein